MALDRYALAARIRELLDGELAAIGFELLDARVYRGGGRLQVRIYLDAPGGVDLADCARASRTVDPLLEESGLVDEHYVIEVSSPGVRRPLRRPEHFARHAGQMVELRGGDPRDPWRLRGRLLSADADGLVIGPEPGPDGDEEPASRSVAHGEILEADLDPDFDPRALIKADRRRRKERRRQDRQERQGRTTRRRRREGE